LLYLLTVLRNGRDTYHERMLASFLQHVTPQPADVYEYDDRRTSLGMCAAHAKCWNAAADSPLDWVFHIEEDMVILRPLELQRLAAVLDMHDHLKQMALVRCPWGFEIEHGGYIPQTPGWYERVGMYDHGWIETTRNWATGPALFKTGLAREFPWDPSPGCETEIGPRILRDYPDAKFGLWGWGEPLCAHVGVERAPGSHGY